MCDGPLFLCEIVLVSSENNVMYDYKHSSTSGTESDFLLVDLSNAFDQST